MDINMSTKEVQSNSNSLINNTSILSENTVTTPNEHSREKFQEGKLESKKTKVQFPDTTPKGNSRKKVKEDKIKSKKKLVPSQKLSIEEIKSSSSNVIEENTNLHLVETSSKGRLKEKITDDKSESKKKPVQSLKTKLEPSCNWKIKKLGVKNVIEKMKHDEAKSECSKTSKPKKLNSYPRERKSQTDREEIKEQRKRKKLIEEFKNLMKRSEGKDILSELGLVANSNAEDTDTKNNLSLNAIAENIVLKSAHPKGITNEVKKRKSSKNLNKSSVKTITPENVVKIESEAVSEDSYQNAKEPKTNLDLSIECVAKNITIENSNENEQKNEVAKNTVKTISEAVSEDSCKNAEKPNTNTDLTIESVVKNFTIENSDENEQKSEVADTLYVEKHLKTVPRSLHIEDSFKKNNEKKKGGRKKKENVEVQHNLKRKKCDNSDKPVVKRQRKLKEKSEKPKEGNAGKEIKISLHDVLFNNDLVAKYNLNKQLHRNESHLTSTTSNDLLVSRIQKSKDSTLLSLNNNRDQQDLSKEAKIATPKSHHLKNKRSLVPTHTQKSNDSTLLSLNDARDEHDLSKEAKIAIPKSNNLKSTRSLVSTCTQESNDLTLLSLNDARDEHDLSNETEMATHKSDRLKNTRSLVSTRLQKSNDSTLLSLNNDRDEHDLSKEAKIGTPKSDHLKSTRSLVSTHLQKSNDSTLLSLNEARDEHDLSNETEISTPKSDHLWNTNALLSYYSTSNDFMEKPNDLINESSLLSNDIDQCDLSSDSDISTPKSHFKNSTAILDNHDTSNVFLEKSNDSINETSLNLSDIDQCDLDISTEKLDDLTNATSLVPSFSKKDFSPPHHALCTLPNKTNSLITRTITVSPCESENSLSDEFSFKLPLPQKVVKNLSVVNDGNQPNSDKSNANADLPSSKVINTDAGDKNTPRGGVSKIWVPRITFNRNNDDRIVECASLKNASVPPSVAQSTISPTFEPYYESEDDVELDYETEHDPTELDFENAADLEYGPYIWYPKYEFSRCDQIRLVSHDSIFKNATLSLNADIVTEEHNFATNPLLNTLLNTNTNKITPIYLPPAKRPPRRLCQKSNNSVSSTEESIPNQLEKVANKGTKRTEISEDDSISLYAESIISHQPQVTQHKLTPKRATPSPIPKLMSVIVNTQSPNSTESVEKWISNSLQANSRSPRSRRFVLKDMCKYFYFGSCIARHCKYLHKITKEIEEDMLQLDWIDLMLVYDYAIKSSTLFEETYETFIKAFVNFNKVTSIVNLGRAALNFPSYNKPLIDLIDKCICALQNLGVRFSNAILKLIENVETNLVLSDVLFDIIGNQPPDEIVNSWSIVRKLLSHRNHNLLDYGVVTDIMLKSYNYNNVELARNILLDILNTDYVCMKSIEVDVHRQFFKCLNKNEITYRDVYLNKLNLLHIYFFDDRQFLPPVNYELDAARRDLNNFNTSTCGLIEMDSTSVNKNISNAGSHSSRASDLEMCNNSIHSGSNRNTSINLERKSNHSFQNQPNSLQERLSNVEKSKSSTSIARSVSPDLYNDFDGYEDICDSEYELSLPPMTFLTEDNVRKSPSQKDDSEELNSNNLLSSSARLQEDDVKILSKIISEGNSLGFAIKLQSVQDSPLSRSFVLNSICLLKQKKPADAYKMFISLFEGLKNLCDLAMSNVLKMLTINMVIVFERCKAYNEASRLLLQYRNILDELTDVEWFKKINGHNLSKTGKLIYFCKILVRGGYLKDCIDIFMHPDLKLMCPKTMWTLQHSEGTHDVDFRNSVLCDVINNAIQTDVSTAKFLVLHLLTEKDHISEIDIWKYFNRLIFKMAKEQDLYREDLKGMLNNILEGWYIHLDAFILRTLMVILVTHISESDALNLYFKCCKKSIYPKIKVNENTLQLKTDFSDGEIFMTLRFYMDRLIKKKLCVQDLTLKIVSSSSDKLQFLINTDSVLQFKHKIYKVLVQCFPRPIYVRDNGVDLSVQIKSEYLQYCINYYRKTKVTQREN